MQNSNDQSSYFIKGFSINNSIFVNEFVEKVVALTLQL